MSIGKVGSEVRCLRTVDLRAADARLDAVNNCVR